jgi:hypothetical protein
MPSTQKFPTSMIKFLTKDTPTDIRYMGEKHLAGRVVEVRKAWYGLKVQPYIWQ